MQTYIISIDVSKFYLVHNGEVLKGLNTKEIGFHKKGLDHDRVLAPSISVVLVLKKNVFNLIIFIGYNKRS